MDFYFPTETRDLCNICANFVDISFVGVSYINSILRLDKEKEEACFSD